MVISTRTARCRVEFDSRGKRESKEFDNANKAKAFYVQKAKQGKNPIVRKISELSKQDRAVLEDLVRERITYEEARQAISEEGWSIIQEQWEDAQEALVDHQRNLMQWFREKRPEQYKKWRETKAKEPFERRRDRDLP